MLLDELRWTVLRRELGSRLEEITASHMTSFVRTVRKQLTTEVHTWEVALNDRRLVTAMAVYRLRDRVTLEAFLRGQSPRAIYRHALERYGGPRRVHYFHQVDLQAIAGGALLKRVTIPWSHQAIIVGVGSTWTYEQVLATAHWEVVF